MTTELTGLHAKFTGDSSDFRAAAGAAIGLVDQYGRALKSVTNEQAAASAASKKLETDFNKLKLETDATYAATMRYNKAAALTTTYAKANKWTTEQLSAELSRLATHYGVAEAAGHSMNEQVRSARFHAANLTAQFYDIGVMLAAGQSPFMLAVQQGSQITQVMQAAGGSVRQTGALLLSAFTALISPTTLLTVGLIAGGAALVQWGMAAIGASERTEELKRREEEYTAVVDALTAATKRLADARAVATGAASSQEELDALRTRAELEKELTENQTKLNQLLAVGTQSTSVFGGLSMAILASQNAKQEELIRKKIEELELALRRLDYEQQLETAEKRRANAYRDAAKARFQAEQDQLEALQKQEDTEARQRELLTLRKNGFHMLAGETAAVSFYLGEGLEVAEELGKVDLDGSVAAAANSAAALARNLGISLENAQRMLQLGYESGGPVIFDPRDPNYDPAKAAQASQFGFTYGNGKEPTKPPAATGGGSTASALEAELEQLRNSLLTQEQLEIESYARRQAVLEDALRQKLITQGEYSAMMEQAEASHQFAMLQASNDGARNVLGSLEQVFQGSKKISAAIALANSYLAFTEVLKDPSYVGRPFARFAAAAAALSSGFQAVAAIKGVQPGSSAGGSLGGSSGAPGGGAGTSTQVSLQLVGGDLYSRDQVIQLINAINSAVADGAQITVR